MGLASIILSLLQDKDNKRTNELREKLLELQLKEAEREAELRPAKEELAALKEGKELSSLDLEIEKRKLGLEQAKEEAKLAPAKREAEAIEYGETLKGKQLTNRRLEQDIKEKEEEEKAAPAIRQAKAIEAQEKMRGEQLTSARKEAELVKDFGPDKEFGTGDDPKPKPTDTAIDRATGQRAAYSQISDQLTPEELAVLDKANQMEGKTSEQVEQLLNDVDPAILDALPSKLKDALDKSNKRSLETSGSSENERVNRQIVYDTLKTQTNQLKTLLQGRSQASQEGKKNIAEGDFEGRFYDSIKDTVDPHVDKVDLTESKSIEYLTRTLARFQEDPTVAGADVTRQGGGIPTSGPLGIGTQVSRQMGRVGQKLKSDEAPMLRQSLGLQEGQEAGPSFRGLKMLPNSPEGARHLAEMMPKLTAKGKKAMTYSLLNPDLDDNQRALLADIITRELGVPGGMSTDPKAFEDIIKRHANSGRVTR